MGAQENNNVSAIRTTTLNDIVGTSATASGTGNVVLGELATATASNGVGIGTQSSVGFNAVPIGKEALQGRERLLSATEAPVALVQIRLSLDVTTALQVVTTQTSSASPARTTRPTLWCSAMAPT